MIYINNLRYMLSKINEKDLPILSNNIKLKKRINNP